jgi:hypothetical protein
MQICDENLIIVTDGTIFMMICQSVTASISCSVRSASFEFSAHVPHSSPLLLFPELSPCSPCTKPPTWFLGESGVTEAVFIEMVRRGQIAANQACPPKAGETSAHLEKDEVIIFRDFFTAGLRFPFDPVVVDTLRLHNMFLHQLTPNSIACLNLYFLLAKTCCFQPSAEDFAFIHHVHYHPKVIAMMAAAGTEGEAEAQYGFYNFTYKEIVSTPVTTYKNKWPSDWTSF